MNDYLIRLENETFDEYRLRTYKMKQLGTLKMTWVEIAEMFSEVWDVCRDESTWRKEAKELLISDVEQITSEEESIKEDLKDLILEYKKERVKLSDERIQNNAYIRRLSREETIIEIAKRAAEKISLEHPLEMNPFIGLVENTESEVIAVISDWHYGLEVNNHWNTFSPEICKKRIRKLLDEVEQFRTEF